MNQNKLNRKINSEELQVWFHEPCAHGDRMLSTKKRSRKGQQADALALGGEEGRDKLR